MLCGSAFAENAEETILSLFRNMGACLPAALLVAMGVSAGAQTCTTQARMQGSTRTALADEALLLATAVKAGDANAVKAATVAEYANNFAPIEYVIRNTADRLKGDTLRVTQVYVLDASSRKAGDTSEADFTCPLQGTTAETDFSIASLPAGMYGFAMVEATGERPWLLAFLLQQENGAWKMAGFYPHARTAAGKDGLWYWNAARSNVKTKPWLAWLEYEEANELLRPASFVSSTSLDKLMAEQRAGAPPQLSEGVSAQAPLVVKAADGQEFHFTSLTNETATDDTGLNLVLHYAAEPVEGAEANRARNLAAAKAMIGAHPELRQGYSSVYVFGDVPGQNPSVLTLKMTEIP